MQNIYKYNIYFFFTLDFARSFRHHSLGFSFMNSLNAILYDTTELNPLILASSAIFRSIFSRKHFTEYAIR